MVSGRTESGFEFEADERLLNDWDVCEQLTRAQSEDKTERMCGFFKLAEMILGEKAKKLKLHVKEDGIVPISKMMLEITEIIGIMAEKSREVKNS